LSPKGKNYLICHPRESGDPKIALIAMCHDWFPAFAGMTGIFGNIATIAFLSEI